MNGFLLVDVFQRECNVMNTILYAVAGLMIGFILKCVIDRILDSYRFNKVEKVFQGVRYKAGILTAVLRKTQGLELTRDGHVLPEEIPDELKSDKLFVKGYMDFVNGDVTL